MTVKHDRGKRRWGLLPWGAVGTVVDVLTFGASKYGPENWRTVEPFEERYFDALVRHLTAWRAGESADPETGLPHLAHAICCALFLLAGPARHKAGEVSDGDGTRSRALEREEHPGAERPAVEGE